MTFDWWPKALTLEALAALAKNPETTGGLTLGAIVTLTARYGFDALPSDPVMLVIALTGIFMGAFFISHTASLLSG